MMQKRATGRRRLAIAGALLCTALMLAGCAARPQPVVKVPDRNIVGLWSNAAIKGQPASLSEIGFSGDGTFKHSGSNALGLPVNFGGRYQVGGSAEGSVVRLTYDDFPDRPTTWFFRLDGDTLTIAPSVQELGSEAAVVLRRAEQQ